MTNIAQLAINNDVNQTTQQDNDNNRNDSNPNVNSLYDELMETIKIKISTFQALFSVI